MERKLQPFSTKIIVMLVILIPVTLLLTLILTSILIPGNQWPPDPPTLVAALMGPVVIVGFLIYGANIRDERTIMISDKASRNGFMFVLYGIPLLIVVLSSTGFSTEVILPLLIMWIGALASACVSAFYYYHK